MSVRRLRYAQTSSLRRAFFIKTKETPNPDCLMFSADGVGFMDPGQSADFPNADVADVSSLAQTLFQIDGVRAVFFADEYITVSRKAEVVDWSELTPGIYAAITTWRSSGEPLLLERSQVDDCEPQEGDDEVVLLVKEILTSKVKPKVQKDGGNVIFIGLDEGVVYVQLQGACSNCPSASQTLKGGIEKMIFHYVAEVDSVVEVTDDEAAWLREQWAETAAETTAAKS
eukprot:NODE_3439_length_894_cov_55.963494_g3417_i0.p1 GENE.NODE_3439_length_894_cov_55.963494_g3417_i0~~NODE_3439_length_894_cov_55.963494_g3417_i0.p1  ORF type:complete len:228 (-),score=19.42 NODE_3439_length_894_cov_55.963494_g3417_i0:158-841(-)